MKLAFLGADAFSLELAAYIAGPAQAVAAGRSENASADLVGHDWGRPQIAWFGDMPPAADAWFQSAAPHATRGDEWEALIDSASVDAVVVARPGNSQADQDRVAEQLRKLVQGGVAVIAAHPVHDSMLIYYELEMIRQESKSVLLPWLPARWHPAMRRLAELASAPIVTTSESSDATGESGNALPVGSLGKIEQVVLERWMEDRSQLAVQRQFAVDVDVARMLAGDLDRLAALGPRSEMAEGDFSTAYANLGVQLTGPQGVLVRWSVAPIQDWAGLRLTLLGSAGRAVLDMPEDGEWTLRITQRERTTTETFDDWNGYAAGLRVLGRAMSGEAVRPRWIDAARCVELAETIPRSLKRGKTIPIHFEDYTEQGTFKGMMTSAGCGLLLLAMGMAFVAALIGPLRLQIAEYWPYLLLVILSLFLLLQSARWIMPDENEPSEVDDSSGRAK